MKKRLLALALCLVMMTSLLPMIAYGDNPDFGVYITGTGFEMSDGNGYALKDDQLTIYLYGHTNWFFTGSSQGLYLDEDTETPVTNELVDGETYFFKYKIAYPENPEAFIEMYHNLNTKGCSLEVSGYTASFVHCSDYSEAHAESHVNIIFRVTKNPHEHQWQFKASGNTLTGTCGSCDIGEVVLTLEADPVTLPNSPFDAAKLVGWDQFHGIFPTATAVFDYKCNGESVDKDDPNPKAGTYQAGVAISGLPGTVEQDGVAARAVSGNQDNNGQAYLWVKYTVADPAITAQTGDNRPIELVMVSVLVFSALAAAAFLLDHKRKYQQ